MPRPSGVLAALVAGGLTAGTLSSPASQTPGTSRPLDIPPFQPLLDAVAAQGLTPGIQAAVVVGDSVVWQGVAGEADLATHRAVTPDTRFYIASTSKALTGLTAAIEADRGTFALTDPLSKALPAARPPDGISADSIRVIDLLTHTHGIDGQGPVSLRVAFTGEYTNAQLLALLHEHRPARHGRAFQYSNLGYDLTGILLAPGERQGWRGVEERDVLAPLGMVHTTSYRSRLADDQIAMPHELGRDGLERVRLAKEDANMGPAGGHFSTAGDLARLLVCELNAGRVAGRQVVPARVIAETQRQHVAQDRTFDTYHRFGWGIGWDLGTFEADTLLHRFGGFSGYFSHVSFMPGHGVGVVVLVNGGDASTYAGDAVANSIYDRLLGRPDAEARWTASLEKIQAELTQARGAIAADLVKRAARRAPLPFPLDAYVGTYANDALGTLRLERTPEGAVADSLGVGLTAVMGVAQSDVEVYDAKANQLRVELLGSGSVITAVAGMDAKVDTLQFLGHDFARK